ATHLRRPGLAAASVATVLGVVVVAFGAALPRPTGGERRAQIAAVQGNVPKPGLDFNAERRAVLDNHARATLRLADQVRLAGARRPELVLWPENASDIDPIRNADAATVIQSATDAVGVPIVVGAVLAEPVGRLSNASIVWGPTDGPVPGPGARYIKRHPAPFAEYIPYRSFFRVFSDKVDLVRRDFVAGTGSGAVDAGGIRIGDIICFEVAYDDHVRETVRSGGQLLVVQTNNATFGYTDESIQQLAMSRLRAVESGRAVVHISTVGVSALIDPDGAVVQRSGHFTTAVLQAALPLRTAQTVATRVGAWPEYLMAAAGLLAAVAGLRRRTVTEGR
ncbi:MAG: apolipoprotein N-acyltransferase, partial [Kineosporiaceae bacterium]